MIKVSDTYTLQEFCEMDDETMELLLDCYNDDKVPELRSLKPATTTAQEDASFDGSFGFCVGLG